MPITFLYCVQLNSFTQLQPNRQYLAKLKADYPYFIIRLHKDKIVDCCEFDNYIASVTIGEKPEGLITFEWEDFAEIYELPQNTLEKPIVL